jgi:hypothetical protein
MFAPNFPHIQRGELTMSVVSRTLATWPGHARARRPRAAVRPRLEAFEERVMPAVTFTLQQLAAVGQTVPGGGGKTYINDFEPGTLTDSGQGTFVADLGDANGVALGGTEGLFALDGSQIQPIALGGQAAPGGGTFFFPFSPVDMNAEGDGAVAFDLNPGPAGTGTPAGIYSYTGPTHTLSPLVVPTVTPAPGGGTFQGSPSRAAVNNNGEIAFAGFIPTTVSADPVLQGSGVFVRSNQGVITKIAAPGDAVPGGTLHYAWNPAINNSGDVAYEASLTGVLQTNGVYLVNATTGQLSVIARTGDQIPQSAGGGVFDNVWGPHLNDRGDLVFTGAVQGTTVGTGPGGDGQGVFMESGGRIIAIARPGQAMPGGGHLVTTANLVTQYDLSNSGIVVFAGHLDNGKDGVFLWSNGTTSVVAMSGQKVSGVGTIENLGVLGGFPFGTRVNDYGQVLLTAKLVGTNTAGSDVLLKATPTGLPSPGTVVLPISTFLAQQGHDSFFTPPVQDEQGWTNSAFDPGTTPSDTTRLLVTDYAGLWAQYLLAHGIDLHTTVSGFVTETPIGNTPDMEVSLNLEARNALTWVSDGGAIPNGPGSGNAGALELGYRPQDLVGHPERTPALSDVTFQLTFKEKIGADLPDLARLNENFAQFAPPDFSYERFNFQSWGVGTLQPATTVGTSGQPAIVSTRQVGDLTNPNLPGTLADGFFQEPIDLIPIASASAHVAFLHGTLFVSDTSDASDSVRITQGGTGSLTLSSNLGGGTFNKVQKVVVALGGGNNSVRIDALPGVTVDVIALDGNNTITVGNVGELVIHVGGGNNTILTGNSSPGAQFLTVSGHGNNVIHAANSNSAVILVAGSGFNIIAAAGYGDSIEVLGNASNQITDTGTHDLVLLGGDGNNTIDNARQGSSTVVLAGTGQNKIRPPLTTGGTTQGPRFSLGSVFFFGRKGPQFRD